MDIFRRNLEKEVDIMNSLRIGMLLQLCYAYDSNNDDGYAAAVDDDIDDNDDVNDD
jgi:hypothetical protein